MKPVIDQKNLIFELPTSMYKMKSIVANSTDDQLSGSNAVSYYPSNTQLADISQQINRIIKVSTPRYKQMSSEIVFIYY